MELVSLRAIDAEYSRALLLTLGFTRVKKQSEQSCFNRFPARQKLLKSFGVYGCTHMGLAPGVNKSSRLMFKNVCSLMCTLPDLVANEAYENTTVVRLDVCPIRHFLFRLSFSGTGRFRSHYVPRSSDPSSDLKQQLIGHWRKTTIVFESPKDEHLVLHAGGTADNWISFCVVGCGHRRVVVPAW